MATTTAAAAHRLTDDERRAFERDGFLHLPGALDGTQLEALRATADRLDADHRAEPDVGPHHILNLHDLLPRDPAFLGLVDHPVALAKVLGVLGWNIALFHTQLVVTPPAPAGSRPGAYAWHRDNNRMNRELGVDHQPRISVKVAYFVTDLPHGGMGNFCVVPGSHSTARSELPDPWAEPDGALEITARAGDALLFDRRLWHAASTNVAEVPRVALFYGYAYRWVRPKSAMDPRELLPLADDPIRRQLLGACSTANGYYDPQDEDVPLRDWVRQHLGEEAVEP
jgi:ectoine hydroxylase